MFNLAKHEKIEEISIILRRLLYQIWQEMENLSLERDSGEIYLSNLNKDKNTSYLYNKVQQLLPHLPFKEGRTKFRFLISATDIHTSLDKYFCFEIERAGIDYKVSMYNLMNDTSDLYSLVEEGLSNNT